MSNSVYFASTILHLYAASVIAAERSNEQAHLVFIDQPEDVEFPLFNIVQQWQQSPFASVQLFHGCFKGLVNKLKQRKHLFAQLENVIRDLRPENIFVGNDRRIEFQFSMHIATSIECQPNGHYMDEGTYTYLGREASSQIGDILIDNLAKKLSYGFWWKNPPTIGGSDWIQTIHVAFPEHVHPLLKNKPCQQLNPEGFTSPALLALSSQLMQHYGFESQQLTQLDVLFTLPHESLFEKNQGYKQAVLGEIRRLQQEGKQVAAKYHPRNSGPDVLELQKDGVMLLPAGISFEAMLPHFDQQTEIWGDVSSTLLIARWLRKELTARYMTINNFHENRLTPLFDKIGVKKYFLDTPK
jgi:hypothetical protein